MIVLQGFYENGKITITDKNLPSISGNVEIIFRQKSWKRVPKRVKVIKKKSASSIVVDMRNEN